jgi:uncharacterized cupin superfamily protein
VGDPSIITVPTDVELEPAPIDPRWILEGTPRARNRLLFKSDDGTATTMIWDCTAGTFNWFYDRDETAYITEGGVILTTATGIRAVATGDAIFFPAGSQATWQVDRYIRKVAFHRQTIPTAAGFALRVWKQLLRAVPRLA